MLICRGSSGVERVLGKDEVAGSNPAYGSIKSWKVATMVLGLIGDQVPDVGWVVGSTPMPSALVIVIAIFSKKGL